MHCPLGGSSNIEKECTVHPIHLYLSWMSIHGLPAFLTSHAKGRALRVGCFSPSCTAACSQAAIFLELMTTSSPIFRNWSARAYPRPLELPVITIWSVEDVTQ